ncbi:hypothetical protein CC1G_14759 [Coprinopsis cinerea okayama7|uniref:Uncharacterized protein n=1 Tax=Coprinopsis cinerea (strain Okayama-7 / 130 / ATCC MYA-4618 / FGSC 9003) TaxID=240176 RepID=D6RNM2_COPC7|nr:hypothetical protein CC1G_14759 [Coprinopsis cinerea okayama7\|eukprot:XP_002910781.1 hypothetical protein CC1G_14759 [Coprinopsis cinerea okayama7\
MLLNTVSQFNLEEEEDMPPTPKFADLDAPSLSTFSSASKGMFQDLYTLKIVPPLASASRGFDSDSDENVLDSDEGDVEDDGSDNQQSTGDAPVAVQESRTDSDAEMSDGASWSDVFDDDSDFLGSKDNGRVRTLGGIQLPKLSSKEYSVSTWNTFVLFTWTPWQDSTLWRKLA